MIELSEKYLINTGTNRACYEHPEDKNKCIKIVISGNNKESLQEIAYYNFLKKRNIKWCCLTEYYGMVDTNYGAGEVVSLIRDFDGKVSKTLSYYIIDNSYTLDIPHLINILKELKKCLEDEKIIVKDLNVVNIVYKKLSEKDGKLIVIDGTNNKYNFINQMSYLNKKQIKKLWKKFINSLFNSYAYNDVKNIKL